MTKQTAKRGASLFRAGHDPRAAALVLLLQVLDEGADSPAALDALLEKSEMVPTDKRLCTMLAYGSLRHYLRVEWFLLRFLQKPEKLPREMYVALIMTFYSMEFLRIPHHASVGWAVSHIRNRFGEGLARVANGVLRAAQRQQKLFHDPQFYVEALGSSFEASALFAGVPAWIAELWRDGYGDEAAACLLEAAQHQAPSGLRLNRLHNGWEENRAALLEETLEGQHILPLSMTGAVVEQPAEPEPVDEALPPSRKKNKKAPEPLLAVGPCGLAFGSTLPWKGKQMEKQGAASRQSAASYAVLEAMQPQDWQGPIWDACAGRGGKTLSLLEMGADVLLASDPSPVRMKALPGECVRLSIPESRIPVCIGASAEHIVADMKNSGELWKSASDRAMPALFGTIVVDAPCSGFGTLSRRPEIRLRRTKDDVAALVATQAAILDAVATQLRPGGTLVYLTCTMNPAENEQQVQAFLQRHPDAVLEQEYHTDWHSPLREFFYAARLRLKD